MRLCPPYSVLRIVYCIEYSKPYVLYPVMLGREGGYPESGQCGSSTPDALGPFGFGQTTLPASPTIYPWNVWLTSFVTVRLESNARDHSLPVCQSASLPHYYSVRSPDYPFNVKRET